MRRPVAAALALATAAASAAWVMAAPSAVGADTAPEYGSWSQVNQAPAGVVTPPTLPAAGSSLTVASDPTGGADAVVAVRAPAPAGSTVHLSLTSTAPMQLASGAQLLACQTVGGVWQPEVNGSWNDRPAYLCSVSATGELDTNGTTVTWTLPAEFIRDEKVDVVLTVAGGGGGGAFNPPDATSVKVDPPAESSAPADSSSAPADASSSLATLPSTSSFDSTGSGSFSIPATPTTPTTAAPSVARPAARPAVPLRAAAHVPFRDTSRRERLMAVSVLLAMLGALWWIAGVPLRGPRLLGSLGAGAGPDGHGPAPRIGGIGRFARVRAAGPTRLL